jgi:hypothetical protein
MIVIDSKILSIPGDYNHQHMIQNRKKSSTTDEN